MNYRETLDYLFSRLAVYQQQGSKAIKADLSNITKICEILHHPEKKFKSIHVAGTNGKGSTANMLASVFQEAGYTTGLYTSPHLKDFRERIRIDGKMISKESVMRFVKEHRSLFEVVQPSFFEWTVGLAFAHFANKNADIAIIETGLGGRLDSTNIIQPEIAVITNIAMDHMAFLGNDLQSIAREKAGIIKDGVPVVIGEKQEEVKEIFEDIARKKGAELIYASESDFPDYLTDLPSPVQRKNVKTAVSTLEKLKTMGWNISPTALEEGLKNIRKNTGLMGRWQMLSQNPLTVCDVAHNEAGLQQVSKALLEQNYRKLHIVFGSVKERELEPIFSLLPEEAEYYFCKANIARAMETDMLMEQARKSGLTAKAYPSVKSAYEAAKKKAAAEDMIFIGGSTFVVAEVL